MFTLENKYNLETYINIKFSYYFFYYNSGLN